MENKNIKEDIYKCLNYEKYKTCKHCDGYGRNEKIDNCKHYTSMYIKNKQTKTKQ